MDTISSRESSGSPLPLVGVIAGVLGLVLGVVALVKVGKANTTLEENAPKIAQIDGIGATATAANDSVAKVKNDLARLQSSTQVTVDKIGSMLGELSADVTKLKEDAKKPAPVAAKGGAPVVAGPGEYVIKSGDSLAKIARAQGISLADLMAVNAGVNPNRLSVGQKIKLPKK